MKVKLRACVFYKWINSSPVHVQITIGSFSSSCDDHIAGALACRDRSPCARLVRMRSEEATLSVCNSEGWRVTFDKKPTKVRRAVRSSA